MARTAQVKKDARIGEAEAERDSGIKVMYTRIIITDIFINQTDHNILFFFCNFT